MILLKSNIIFVVITIFIKDNFGYQFGCAHFYPEAENYYLTNTENSYAAVQPVFSDLENDPITFHSDSALIHFVEVIRESVQKFYENRPYDTIEPFIKFYQDYKEFTNKHRAYGFNEFFSRYRPSFDLGKSYVGNVVSLLKYVAAAFPEDKVKKVLDKIYFAAVRENVAIDQIAEDEFITIPEDSNYLTNVYGTMKIKVLNTKGNTTDIRNGYIILDSYIKPIVLMDDRQEPHFAQYKLGPNQKKTYEIEKNRGKTFAVCQYLNDDDEQEENALYDLIILEKPYCSFQEITHRLSLIRNDRFKYKYNNNMMAQSMYKFDYLSADPKIEMQIFDEKGVVKTSVVFDLNEKLPAQLKANEQMLIDQGALFGISNKTFVEKEINQIAEIFKDREFKNSLVKYMKRIRPSRF